MRRALALALAVPIALMLTACATITVPEQQEAMASPNGQFVEWEAIPATGLPDQRISIWLPPEYAAQPDHHFPVLYMWDGQNLFDPANTHYGKAWMVQDVLSALVAQGKAEPHIVVGIWSPPGKDRYRVYLPQFAGDYSGEDVAANIAEMAGGSIASRRQLDWVADTLKPRIDGEFRTRPDAADTTVIGSSMGGIMSCYAIGARPDVFARAACVSAHFALIDPEIAPANEAQIEGLWADYLGANLGPPNGRRVWMDHGTIGLDGNYAPWQKMIASNFADLGWSDGEDFTARTYEGAEHDENYWRARLPDMLEWLWRKD